MDGFEERERERILCSKEIRKRKEGRKEERGKRNLLKFPRLTLMSKCV